MENLILLVVALGLGLFAAAQFLGLPAPWAALAKPAPMRGRSGAALAATPARPLDPRVVLALLPVWLIVTLWQTAPLYRYLGSGLPSGHDTTQYVWNLWWMKYALLDLHQDPFYTTYMFAPHQSNLAFHTFTPLNGVLSIPLQLLFGLNTAFNLLFLAGFVASAAGAFLLVRQETRSTLGAVVGSVVFPFAPYVMAHLNGAHFGAVNTWATPFFALFLLRWLRGQRPRDGALAGLFLGCVGLNGLDQVSFAVAFGAVAVLGSLWLRWRAAGMPLPPAPQAAAVRRWLRGAALLAAVSVVVFLPELAPYVQGLGQGWSTGTPISASDSFAPDLLGTFMPLYLHPVWGSWVTPLAAAIHGLDQPKVIFTGFTALLLALLALGHPRRASVLHWWAMTLLFWLLSLGPHLHLDGSSQFSVGGATFQVPLPYLLYHDIPLVGGGRIPGYASLITSLGLAVLSGYAIAWLTTLLPQPRYSGPVLATVAACLVLFESLTAPLPLYVPQVDPVYTLLAHQPGQQAVLEEPLGWRDGRMGVGPIDRNQLYYATVSDKPIVAGYFGRVPDDFFTYYTQQPALAQFVEPDGPPTPQSQEGAAVRALLHHMGVGYIIVHRYDLYDTVTAYVQRVVKAQPFYQDSQLTAYRVL